VVFLVSALMLQMSAHTALFIVLLVCTISHVCPQVCRPRGASGLSGRCQNTNRPCSGQYYRGACPGASNIQCCVSSSSSGGSSSRNTNSDNGGNTMPTSNAPVGAGWGSYQAPSSARSVLGNLFSSVRPSPVRWGYTGAKATFMLPGGAFYVDSKMDTDCDGAPSCPSIDPHGQRSTSWTWRGSPIDALKTNYFVLPSNIKSRLGSTRLGLGDIAAVVYNGRLEFAVYADNGPTSKIGEGSVKLVQALGFNPFRNGRICCGITSGVVWIVFPGSRGSYSSPYDRESVRQAGMSRLNALIGGSRARVNPTDSEFSEQQSAVPLSPELTALIIVAVVFVALIVIAAIIGLVKLHMNSVQDGEQRP